ncbi:Mhp366/Mhp367 family surface (lipo)protein [Mesomycoplasma ovipneumoniae]|uniref:Mhp366/Mhp367 family surface (lipo)protein n=1 Tax=Mesomycoplasma ovipneumoniae TaxID=29562 RepID=UPI00311ABE9C
MKNLSKYLFYLGFLSPFAVISCTSQIELVRTNPPKVEKNLPKVENKPPKVETDPSKVETNPPKVETDPSKVESNLPKVETNPPKVEKNLPEVETKPPEIEINPPKVETNEDDQKQPEKIDSLKPDSEETKETTEKIQTDTAVKPEIKDDFESVEQTQPIFDFVQVNNKSVRNFRTDLLSDLERNDFKAPNNLVSNYSRYFLRNWENVVKKENQNAFLGQKNDNLKVYLLDRMNPNLVGDINAKQNHFAYFNHPALGNYYNLPWFGFNSDSLEQKRFSNIFTRNIRFATGTGIFLNANSEKAAFLTNAHVIHPQRTKIPFWKLMNKKVGQNQLNARLIKFLQYYDDFKIKELDNRILFRLFEQEEKLKKGIPNLPPSFQSNVKIDEYMENLYQNYFELAEWDNYDFDIAVFYFNYSKFINDVDKLIKYFSEHQQGFINSTYSLQNGKFQNFVNSFAEFKKYWQKISKFPPLKISDRIWDDGDFDYTTKIGMFWANNLFSKNVFKGVNFRRDNGDPRLIAANFFATNGPGASGSGIFNADGSLAFINRSILTVNGNVNSLFYDQFGLTSHLTSGIALRARNYNLVERILKLYVK